MNEDSRARECSSTARLRKTWQLCHQVAETLAQIFAGECGDDTLAALRVVTVEPLGDASQLLVVVTCDEADSDANPEAVGAALARAAGWLRSEVAAAISRRRTPRLVFQFIPPGAGAGSCAEKESNHE